MKFKKAFSFHLFQGVSRPCWLNSSPVWNLSCSSDNYNKEGISTLLLYFGTLGSETLVLVFLVVSWSITWIFSHLPGLQFRTPADYPSWHAVILILGRSSCVRILTSLVAFLLWKSVLTDFIFFFSLVLYFAFLLSPPAARHSFYKGVAWFLSFGSFVCIPIKTDWEFQWVGVWKPLYDQHTGLAYIARCCCP